MEHNAVDFAHPGYTEDEAIAGALTAEDGEANFDLSQPHPAEGEAPAYRFETWQRR